MRKIPKADRPNILIIMSDEHDPRISHPYGHPFAQTPALQRLADRGIVFDNAYCNVPLCTPSRASFMTGKYAHRIGVWDNMSSLSSDEPTWAHRLNALGYETALAGKAHFIGPDQSHGFQCRLVDDIHGSLNTSLANWDSGDRAGSPEMRRRFEDIGPGDSLYQQYDDEVTARSVEYLGRPERRTSPWALSVGLITPHFPLVVRQPYFDLYQPVHADLPPIPPGHLERLHPQNQRLRRYFALEGVTQEQVRRGRAAYYGLVTFCDERVGQILDALERNGLSDDTLVVYVADHGEMLGQHGMWWKCTFYEGSARIPFIVSLPTRFAPGRRSSATSLIDLTRTLLELAEAAEAPDLDGRSLVPLLDGSEPDGPGLALAEYEAHGTIMPARMVRRGRHKLNYYSGEPPELFDLERDPGEFEDLAGRADYAPVQDELTTIALRDWDPLDIERRVRQSQRLRRIVFDGSTHLPKEKWAPTH